MLAEFLARFDLVNTMSFTETGVVKFSTARRPITMVGEKRRVSLAKDAAHVIQPT